MSTKNRTEPGTTKKKPKKTTPKVISAPPRKKYLQPTKYVQVGRVAYIGSGKEAGKLCVIVDIIDQNRVLIDGPSTNVARQPYGIKHLHLTRFVLQFSHSAPTRLVRREWHINYIQERWEQTQWFRNLDKKRRRAEMTDFDRYKLSVAKIKRNRLIEKEYQRLRRIDGVERPGSYYHLREQQQLKENLKKASKGQAQRMLQFIAAKKPATDAKIEQLYGKKKPLNFVFKKVSERHRVGLRGKRPNPQASGKRRLPNGTKARWISIKRRLHTNRNKSLPQIAKITAGREKRLAARKEAGVDKKTAWMKKKAGGKKPEAMDVTESKKE